MTGLLSETVWSRTEGSVDEQPHISSDSTKHGMILFKEASGIVLLHFLADSQGPGKHPMTACSTGSPCALEKADAYLLPFPGMLVKLVI